MEEAYRRLTALIDSVWPAEPVDIICAAVPGPLNPYTGIIMETPNIPSWTNYPLAELLSKKYNVLAYIGNDANLAVLGEWLYGAGKGHHDIVYLTISTGIGGGVICGDKFDRGLPRHGHRAGAHHRASRWTVCSCGVKGTSGSGCLRAGHRENMPPNRSQPAGSPTWVPGH